jgi:hypothetical protein
MVGRRWPRQRTSNHVTPTAHTKDLLVSWYGPLAVEVGASKANLVVHWEDAANYAGGASAAAAKFTKT